VGEQAVQPSFRALIPEQDGDSAAERPDEEGDEVVQREYNGDHQRCGGVGGCPGELREHRRDGVVRLGVQ